MIPIKALADYLNKQIKTFGGTWSYIVRRRKNDAGTISEDMISLNEGHIHRSASMIKVLILAALCASDISFEEKLRIDSVPRVEGGGALQEMNGDALLTVHALASLMIVLSDNLATNILIDKLGMDNINRYAKQLGLQTTKLQRAMMDFKAAQRGSENMMSPADYDRLLWHIYDKRREPRFDAAWKILGRQQFRDRIPYHWDEDIIFHHKTGELDGVEHDGGILEGQNAAYSIIIFASGLKSNAVGGMQEASLGYYIYNYLEKEKS